MLGWQRIPQRGRAGLRFAAATVLIGPTAFTAMGWAMSGFWTDWPMILLSHIETTLHFAGYVLFFFPAIAWVRTRPPMPLWVRFLGAFLLCVAGTSAAVLVANLIGLDHESPVQKFLRTVVYGLVLSPVLLLMEHIWDSLGEARREVERRALAEERERRSAAEARWTSLESRLHPHFVFNSLTSIRELMHQYPCRADLMIQRFAELLRYSLDAPQHPLISLAEELRMVKGYLEIEQMRLATRLRWTIEAEPGLDHLKIPSMSLLTLAENAIKHSISARRSGGQLTVHVRRAGDDLLLQVADDGPGFDAAVLPAGRGLDLLRERLELLYAERARLHVERREPTGVQVEVRLPFHRLESLPNAETTLLRG